MNNIILPDWFLITISIFMAISSIRELVRFYILLFGNSHCQKSKVFTRKEIKEMSPDEFLENEKEIFNQLAQGLIK